MWIVFQSLGLKLHRAAILLNEFSEHKFQERRRERQPLKKIPGGNDIDAAVIARDRSNCSQARKPVLARTDNLGAQIGQHEINRGVDGIRIGIHAKQLVGRTVR